MFSKLRSRCPDHGTVVAYLALFLALGGGAAYAADTIGSSDVIDESLLTQDFKNGEVRAVDLAPNSVGSGKVVNDSLTGIDVGDGGLTGSDLAAGAIGAPQLQDLGVIGAKLANRAVTTDKLASDAVTRDKLGFEAVDQNAMDRDSVAGTEIVDSSVRAEDIGLAHVGKSEIGIDAVGNSELGTIVQRTKTIDVGGSDIDGDRAVCNTGEQVISGGSRAIPGPFVTTLDSHRDGNGWRVTVQNETFRDDVVSLEIHAYCLVP